MKLRAWIALVLSGALVVSTSLSAAGAGSSSSTWLFGLKPLKAPLTKKKVTLTMFASAAALAPPYNDMLLFKKLEKATNVHINWIQVAGQDATEKMNLTLASGNLPDAFFSAPLSPQQLVQYGKDGAFIPFNGLLKYMPNVQRIFKDSPTLKATVTAPNGQIYSLPGGEGLGHGHGWIGADPYFLFINKAWLTKLHLKVPTTLAQLHTDLVAFKKHIPGSIPMSYIEDWWCADIGDLFGGFGVADNGDHIMVRNGKVMFDAAQPQFRDAVNYFHKWASEGLIDQEAFTQSDKQYFAKGSSSPEKVGAFIWWESTEFVTPAHDKDYTLVGPLAGPKGIKEVGFSNGYWAGPGSFVITKSDKDPVLTAKWIDLLFAPYEAAQLHWGPLGDVFALNKKGELVYKPLPAGVAMGEYRQKVSASMGVILPQWFGKYVAPEARAEVRIQRVKKIFAPHMEKQHYPFGAVYFTQDELKTLAPIQTNINNYVKKMKATWLLRGGVTGGWSSYLGTLRGMGLDQMLKILQTALDRYAKHGGKLDA